MNATLTTDSRHEQSIQYEQHPHEVRRVGPLDRAALHLGVALIKWGRRPAIAPEYERRANRLERALVQERREARLALAREQVVLDYALITRVR